MSRNRAKGTAAESAVVAYLQAHGFPYAERRALAGNKDRGDIAGVLGTVIEVKNTAHTELGAHLDEARREQANDGARYGVLWLKRRGKGSPGDWYCIVDGATMTRLLADALGVEQGGAA